MIPRRLLGGVWAAAVCALLANNILLSGRAADSGAAARHHSAMHRLARDARADNTSNDELAQQVRGTPLAAHAAPYALWAHGHWVSVHHAAHGAEQVLRRVRELRAEAPVDAVVLDSFWQDPADCWAFHPQRYPDGAAFSVALRDGGRTHLVVWASALVPAHDSAFRAAARAGWFLHGGDGKPLLFSWEHDEGEAPTIQGALIDFSHADATAWLAGRVTALLSSAQVDGFRLAGVDMLLGGRTVGVVGAKGYYEPADYAKEYYRFFFDIGRRVRGPDFLVMARAVDSRASRNVHLRSFAPTDVVFAGWVGNHPFTFAGLRNAALHVVHSAYAGYLNVGPLIGGTLRRAVPQPDGGEALARAAAEDSGDHRERELFVRWAQLAASLPFMCAPAFSAAGQPVTYGADVVAHYAALVRRHRQHALYFSAVASRAFYARLGSADHVSRKNWDDAAVLAHRPQEHVVWPAAQEVVHFDAPTTWAFHVGRDVLVAPIIDSFGNHTRLAVTFRGAPGGQWYDTSRPWLVFADGDTVQFAANASAPGSVPLAAAQTDALFGQLAFRRRDSLIPLILPPSAAAGLGSATDNDHVVIASLDNPSSNAWTAGRESSAPVFATMDVPARTLQQGIAGGLQVNVTLLGGSFRADAAVVHDATTALVAGLRVRRIRGHVAVTHTAAPWRCTCRATVCTTVIADVAASLPEDISQVEVSLWARLRDVAARDNSPCAAATVPHRADGIEAWPWPVCDVLLFFNGTMASATATTCDCAASIF
jgi:hypothetical protein